MKNPTQLKAIIKNKSKEIGISAQLLLQNYMLERFLERLSLSSYRDYYVIKGGFLIASIVGLNTRSTMDMDITIKGKEVSKENVTNMIQEILQVDVADNINFELKNIQEIRETANYLGYRASLVAIFSNMKVPIKLDITTGDAITPKEIEHYYSLLLEERSINILAYNIITVLAEKIETILSRGNQSTRPRDFYDVYILEKLKGDQIDDKILYDALQKTATQRGSIQLLHQYQTIIMDIQQSDVMLNRWNNYQKDFDYAKKITFEEICSMINQILNRIMK